MFDRRFSIRFFFVLALRFRRDAFLRRVGKRDPNLTDKHRPQSDCGVELPLSWFVHKHLRKIISPRDLSLRGCAPVTMQLKGN
jgi:hypothetical protein